MGKISDSIRELIQRQLADRGLVVWYDPDRVYGSLAQTLTLDDARVFLGGDGFFRLREALEPCLEFVTTDGEVTPGCGVPPKMVVYVPHVIRLRGGHAGDPDATRQGQRRHHDADVRPEPHQGRSPSRRLRNPTRAR